MINVEVYPREPEFQHILELYPVQPANKFLPEWYKKNKRITKEDTMGLEPKVPHAKECPAIQDELTNGFVIPAWSDMYFEIKGDTVSWELPIGRKLISAKLHQEWQWVGSQSSEQIKLMNLNEVYNYGVLKLMSPYYFKTPKGYGLRFSDMFYHNQKHIRILPGQVETDIWHEINFPFEFVLPMYNESKFHIKAGDPLIMVTPYKKDNKFKIINNSYNEDFKYKQDHNSYKLHSITSDFPKYRNYKSNEEE